MRRLDTLDHLSLNVRDVRRAHEFYCGFMGLDAGPYFEEDGAEVLIGSAVLMLLPGTPSPQGVHFGFREESRDAVREWAAKASGAAVPVEFGPDERSWGGYEVTIHDPDGYAIQIWTDSSD